MVSAAKLRNAQNAIISMRPYASKLKEILENVSSSLDASEGIYSEQREIKHVLLVPIVSNRGLCGAFNSNVIKLTNKLAYEEYKNYQVSALSIGKKASDYFRRTELNIIGTDMPKRLYTLYDELTFDNVAKAAGRIMRAFVENDFDRIDLVFNQFKNASVQILTREQFLPVLPPGANKKETKKFKADYIFEPDKEKILEELIPKSLKTQLFKAILESHAAEHGARMTAMHKATDNATELLKGLKLSYNKARQSAITNEILEIVGGAEALSN